MHVSDCNVQGEKRRKMHYTPQARNGFVSVALLERFINCDDERVLASAGCGQGRASCSVAVFADNRRK